MSLISLPYKEMFQCKESYKNFARNNSLVIYKPIRSLIKIAYTVI